MLTAKAAAALPCNGVETSGSERNQDDMASVLLRETERWPGVGVDAAMRLAFPHYLSELRPLPKVTDGANDVDFRVGNSFNPKWVANEARAVSNISLER